MAWFTQDAIDFFRELELNNEKPWFEANKKRYEASVKKPMEAFVARLIELMRKKDPSITTEPKKAIFRIYRDIRFSKDKTPYKTNAGASITGGERMDFSRPGIYFHFDPRTLGVASGYYNVEPDRLLRFRRYIAANLGAFQKELDRPAFKKHFGGIAGEKNKIIPAEFKEPAAKQPFLFNKQFYYWGEREVEEILRDDLDKVVMEFYEAAVPMNEFLGKALE